jgi:RNA polymerase sigma factor (sigma-70 family)
LTETAEEDNLGDETAVPNLDVDGSDDPRRAFLRQWLAANEPALRTALRPIAGSVAGVRGVSGAEAVDDLLVEVVGVALGRAFARYDLNYPSPRLWLLRIAHLVCRRWRDEARTARDRTAAPAQGGDTEGQEDLLERIPGPDSDDPAHSVVDRAWALHRLTHLSPEDRGIVQCRIIEDIPYEEAAKRLGISEGAARVRYLRAVKRLRRQEAEDNKYGYPAGHPLTGIKSRSTGGKRNEEAHE